MEYFVSVENTPYYHWQLELLIESFKKNNCENELLIALAKADSPLQAAFCRNLLNHERIYGHENVGNLRGFSPLNQLYSLVWSVQFGKLNQPFAWIQPDMVLKHRLSLDLGNYPEVIFAPDPFFTFEEAASNVGPFWDWANTTKAEIETRWVPIGPLMIFNNIPVTVFERAVTLCEALALRQLDTNNKIWEHTHRLAWAINLSDYLGQLSLRGDYNFTSTMLDGGDSPFIDYSHGMPPVFNKVMFQYKPPVYSSLGDPFKILAENSPTPNSFFISELAKANLDAR